jgi:hypothetical protein
MVGRRIIFVHGMGRKPPKHRHLQQWQLALRHSLWTELPDETTSMACSADLRNQRTVPHTPGNRRVIKALRRDAYLFFYTRVGTPSAGACKRNWRRQATNASPSSPTAWAASSPKMSRAAPMSESTSWPLWARP